MKVNWVSTAVVVRAYRFALERSYGLDGNQLTPSLGWSLPALRSDGTRRKTQVAPWWGECSKEAFNTGLDGVARALKKLRRLPIGQARWPQAWATV
jgi:putative transposase